MPAVTRTPHTIVFNSGPRGESTLDSIVVLIRRAMPPDAIHLKYSYFFLSLFLFLFSSLCLSLLLSVVNVNS